jgi:hypothetical protein
MFIGAKSRPTAATAKPSQASSAHFASVWFWPSGTGHLGHIGIGVDTECAAGSRVSDPRVGGLEVCLARLAFWDSFSGEPKRSGFSAVAVDQSLTAFFVD